MIGYVCEDCGKVPPIYRDVIIDKKLYCHDCLDKHPEYCHYRQVGDKMMWVLQPRLFRLATSSMDDGPRQYVTSLKKIEELYGPIKKIVFRPRRPLLPEEDDYLIIVGDCMRFRVSEPSDEDLELMRAIGIEGKGR